MDQGSRIKTTTVQGPEENIGNLLVNSDTGKGSNCDSKQMP